MKFCAVLALFILPLFAGPTLGGEVQSYNSEIHFFGGAFLGNSVVLKTGFPVFTQVNGVFEDRFIGGARLTYNLTPYLGVEGGLGFSPASVTAAGKIDGGTTVASVVHVDTIVLNANLVLQPAKGAVRPFATGGIAAIHFGFDTSQYGTLTPAETDFAWNVGGGIKVPLKNEVMLRADGRYYRAYSAFARDPVNFTEVSGGITIRFNF